jgi:exportin-2 (importin alpha re-exporter)
MVCLQVLESVLIPFRPGIFLALLDLFTLPQDLTYTNGTTDISELDPEEAGFQSSFSKLGASEKILHDPIKEVGDEKVFAGKELARRSKEKPGVVSVIHL